MAASKILKIKDYVEALGGIAKAVEQILKCCILKEMLREGGLALVNIVAEILGKSQLLQKHANKQFTVKRWSHGEYRMRRDVRSPFKRGKSQ